MHKRSIKSPLLRFLTKACSISCGYTQKSIDVNKSRRSFAVKSFKAGLAISAGMLNSSCANVVQLPKSKKAPVITVIGAGMAGLNCAYQLKKAGITTKIYEASTRAGGRIFTAKNIMGEGLTTELGGEFIDSIHEDMLSLVNEFGLSLLDSFEDPLTENTYYFNGQIIRLADIIEAFKPFADRIKTDIDSIPDDIGSDFPENGVQFDNISIHQYFDNIGLTGVIRKLLEVAFLTEYGLETNEQSALNFLLLFSPDTRHDQLDIFGTSDERYKIRGGNERVIEELEKRLPGQIEYGCRLVSITKASDRYSLIFDEGADSKEITSDLVIITLPFSVLRNVQINCPLPEWKINAIQQLGYGTNAKLLLGFKERAWRPQGFAGGVFSDTALQSGWDNSQLQDGTQGSFTVYLGGNAGKELGNNTIESDTTKHISILENIWPGATANYNNISKKMAWPSHPYALGSYSCYKPGQYTSIAGCESKPVDGLYFAGEHCSRDFQGFMNGAAESGRNTAEEIIKLVTKARK